jgi:hypothetical protein
MRSVQTRAPSFPEVSPDTLLASEAGVRWQVLCGDRDHWRAGLYSPDLGSLAEVRELERHDCPELFLLLSGALTLVLADPAAESGLRELALEVGRPVLVTAPHNGYCPRGPGTGLAFVVERDRFDTEYRPADGWR